MVHLHESILDDLPMFYHDTLFMCLWWKLEKSIPDLKKIMDENLYIMNQHEINKQSGNHDLLFFLKCLDLDIRNDYPLGTVYGYGKNEELKKFPTHMQL